MRCIICFQEKQPSDEHVIPLALGGTFTIDRVCKDCNDDLGNRVDAPLTKQFKIEERRAQFNLAGQSGSVPDPLKPMLRRPMTGTEDPDHRVLVRRNPYTGALEGRTIPEIEFEVQAFPNNLYRVELRKCYIDSRESLENIERLARKALQKAGLTDEKAVQEMCAKFLASLERDERRLEFESTYETHAGGHQLGILKIAYEMSWYWLGDSWLADPQAETMRSALRGEAPKMQVKLFEPGRFFLDDYNNQRMHLVFIFPAKRKWLIVVRLLDVFAVGFIGSAAGERYACPVTDALIMDAAAQKFKFGRLQEIIGSFG